MALLCFVKLWEENPVSVYVNEKFYNKNLFLDLFSVMLIVFQILYCLQNVYRGSSSLLNFLSHWIVGASTCQHVPAKHTRERRWCTCRLSDAKVRFINPKREINPYFSVKSVLPSTVSPPLSLWRRVVVRFTWEIGNSLPKRKGKVVLCSRVMTCYSF